MSAPISAVNAALIASRSRGSGDLTGTEIAVSVVCLLLLVICFLIAAYATRRFK